MRRPTKPIQNNTTHNVNSIFFVQNCSIFFTQVYKTYHELKKVEQFANFTVGLQ